MKHTQVAGQYPVLPLRTEVQLPGHVGPLEVGREASVRAIEAATRDDNLIIIVPQKNPAVREPAQRDLHEIGVRAEVVQVCLLYTSGTPGPVVTTPITHRPLLAALAGDAG